VANAKLQGDRRKATLADGGNLHLQLSLGSDDTVNKSWLFQYEQDFKRHWLGLGPVHTISLAEARQKARSLRQQLLDGIDPLEAKREIARARLARKAEQAKLVTFAQAAEMYMAAHSDSWTNPKHRAQWRSSLEAHVYPRIGSLAVSNIETGHIIKVLEPIWKTIPETASRVRGRIESILDFATVREFRSGENPARWRGHIAELFPARSKVRGARHHGALPYEELPVFLAELRKKTGQSASALEFTILTAARTGEVMGATWDEIDFKTKAWIIPGVRMKAGTEHRVPLSDRVLDILKALPRRGDRVFGLRNQAMLELLNSMRPGVTVHGFRTAFRTWAAERTNYPHEIAELALAHSVGDVVVRAYKRTDLFDKRRRLMAEWAKFCSRPVPTTGATVTSIGRGATERRR
jgi:integrase